MLEDKNTDAAAAQDRVAAINSPTSSALYGPRATPA